MIQPCLALPLPHLTGALCACSLGSSVSRLAQEGFLHGEQGRIFIDRDGRWFRLVLNFLRDGGCELPESSVDRRELLREADYYQARFV